MNRKLNYLLISVAIISLVAAIAWNLSGSSVTGTVRQFILRTAANSINGTLSVGDVAFSMSGTMIAKQVELKDKAGALIASAQTLSIDFDVTDLLSRQFDVDRVRKISLDGLVLNLNRDKEAHWNTEGVLRKSATGPVGATAGVFRGQAVVTNALISVSTSDSRYVFKNVAGIIDFAKYPDLTMDLKTKDGSSSITAKGTWNFSGGGNVAITLDGVEPTSFGPNIPMKGAVTSTFALAGTTDKPTATGSFKVPGGALGTLAFSNAVGDFSFADESLTLSNTTFNALGGSISASGPVSPYTRRYTQKVAGNNIDSAQLSDKDIQGRLNFTADVRGQGPWEGANADGTFNMGSGTISGISFDALTGNFSKRGSQTRYYNLRATIAGQTINLGDADNINALKMVFKTPTLPGIPTPTVPKVPVAPSLPKVPSLPRLF